MKQALIILFAALLISCGKEDDNPQFSCGEEVSLERDIMPIINTYCAVSGCHLDEKNPILTTKLAVQTNAANIRREVAGLFMPPTSATPLEADDIQKIKCWVDDGAEDN